LSESGSEEGDSVNEDVDGAMSDSVEAVSTLPNGTETSESLNMLL
jgi:hypothetical protein